MFRSNHQFRFLINYLIFLIYSEKRMILNISFKSNRQFIDWFFQLSFDYMKLLNISPYFSYLYLHNVFVCLHSIFFKCSIVIMKSKFSGSFCWFHLHFLWSLGKRHFQSRIHHWQGTHFYVSCYMGSFYLHFQYFFMFFTINIYININILSDIFSVKQ